MNALAIPRGNFAAAPAAVAATFVALPDGRAWVTIGQTSCPYANAELARSHLRAMEQRGEVRVHWREASAPC